MHDPYFAFAEHKRSNAKNIAQVYLAARGESCPVCFKEVKGTSTVACTKSGLGCRKVYHQSNCIRLLTERTLIVVLIACSGEDSSASNGWLCNCCKECGECGIDLVDPQMRCSVDNLGCGWAVHIDCASDYLISSTNQRKCPLCSKYLTM